MGAGGNLLYDLFRVVYRRVTGGDEEGAPASVEELEAARGGDIAALIEAVEPSVRLGHNVINHGVINININAQAREARVPVASFTPQTKQYIWESVINNEVRLKLFSMASFNANQGTGRAFDLEAGRSIPFELATGVDRQSVDTLLESISSYTRRMHLGDNLISAVAVMYTSVESPDGRIKKIRILAVRNDIQDFNR